MYAEDYTALLPKLEPCTNQGWFEARRAYDEHLRVPDDELLAWCQSHIAAWPHRPPDAFAPSPSQVWRDVHRAFGASGYMTRLLSVIDDPEFISVSHRHVGLSKKFADSRLFHDAATVNAWKSALFEKIDGPFIWRLETGQNLQVHAHAVAAASGLTGRGVRRQVYDPVNLVRYLRKGVPYLPEALFAYVATKRLTGGARVPNKSGPARLPNSRTWKHLEVIDA